MPDQRAGMTRGRRGFLVNASGAITAVAATAVTAAPHVIAQPKVQWGLSTA